MFFQAIVSVSVLAFSASAAARTFTVKNNCDYTIWPAMWTDWNLSTSKPDHATGWEASAGSEESFTVPNDWKGGRIWGRTDCDFSKPGPQACATGSCNGNLECDIVTGTGIAPVTVAEWTLSSDGQDYYDVSLVDGFNLPMAITSNPDCGEASCPVDLNKNCPQELVGPSGSGCHSACTANLDGNPADSANCCTGSHDTADTCPPSEVEYYEYFKNNCPNSYAYAYDNAGGSPILSCDSEDSVVYTLIFCP